MSFEDHTTPCSRVPEKNGHVTCSLFHLEKVGGLLPHSVRQTGVCYTSILNWNTLIEIGVPPQHSQKWCGGHLFYSSQFRWVSKTILYYIVLQKRMYMPPFRSSSWESGVLLPHHVTECISHLMFDRNWSATSRLSKVKGVQSPSPLGDF